MVNLIIVTPAYNERENLVALYERFCSALDAKGLAWRWLLVDDGSDDGTFAALQKLAIHDARIGGLRLRARNGSHHAIVAGLRHCADDAEFEVAAVMAADLQDPPEALTDMIARWQSGAEIVFARRSKRPDLKFGRLLAARLTHLMIKVLLWRSNYPASGTDMVLFGRKALLAISADQRPVGNIFVKLAKLPFTSAAMNVAKAPRLKGKSGWQLAGLIKIWAASLHEAMGINEGKPSRPIIVSEVLGWGDGFRRELNITKSAVKTVDKL